MKANGIADANANVAPKEPARKVRALITAGGTREPIDTVRSLTNLSTGLTGLTIAQKFIEDGYEVTLIRSESSNHDGIKLQGIREITFVTFSDLENILRSVLGEQNYDVIIHAAAVGDYALDRIETPAEIRNQNSSPNLNNGKIGKIDSNDRLVLHFKKNPKLIDNLRSMSRNKNVKIVAFKLTCSADTKERESEVRKLVSHAKPDFVVLNDVGEISANSHAAKILRSTDMFEIANTKTKQQLAAALGQVLLSERMVEL